MAKRGKRKPSIGSMGKKRGLGGAISSIIVVTLLISALIAWTRVHEINSPTAALDYFRDWSGYMTDCGAQEWEWKCDSIFPDLGDGNNTGDKDADVSKDQKDAIAALASIKVAKEQKVDYDRSEWRHWTGSPCNAREAILKQQGENVKTDSSCKILSGKWFDPFGGETFTNSSKLDIDHVIPLSYAARHGGNNWSADRKEQFANDPIHLVAVSASENRSKGDSGPSDYMPPRGEFHCEYSTMWVNTVAKYDLTVTSSDHKALEKGLATC